MSLEKIGRKYLEHLANGVRSRYDASVDDHITFGKMSRKIIIMGENLNRVRYSKCWLPWRSDVQAPGHAAALRMMVVKDPTGSLLCYEAAN